MRYIEIEQAGNPIRRRSDQRQTLIGLKLNKIGRVSWLPDTPATRGMIDKVRHLVKITHDSAAPRVAVEPPAPDEAVDIQMLRDLICDANGIVLEPYDKAALNRGKRPDFKLMKDRELVGYCEMKSLFDQSLGRKPKQARACCTVAGDRSADLGRECLPYWFVMIIATVIITIFPNIALWLPNRLH